VAGQFSSVHVLWTNLICTCNPAINTHFSNPRPTHPTDVKWLSQLIRGLPDCRTDDLASRHLNTAENHRRVNGTSKRACLTVVTDATCLLRLLLLLLLRRLAYTAPAVPLQQTFVPRRSGHLLLSPEHFYRENLPTWWSLGFTIGNESVPIQLAQCWFPGLTISNAKIYIFFQIKYTEAILSNSTRKLLWFEISKMLIADKKLISCEKLCYFL